MPDIYEQHEKAFSAVSAFVVLHKGERVATIAFKHPRVGAGRLYAYVHWFGQTMVRGFAVGWGYDKKSAAAAAAVRKTTPRDGTEAHDDFCRALSDDGGAYWDDRLRTAGFTVLQAV